MGMESFNQFNNKKEHKIDGTQLRINFDDNKEKNKININNPISLEEEIKKNREGSVDVYKTLTEEELELLKKEKPVEYFAIMSAIEENKKEDNNDYKELHTEYDLEEEIEKQMNKDDPSEEYYNRFNKNLEHGGLRKVSYKKHIKKLNKKNNYKTDYHKRYNIDGPIMPFDPLK